VEWSENFVDMRSVVYPDPYYTTKFKMRWDNDRLYVGAVLQERDFWATNTKHDSNIWQENGFEMLVDVDGTMFNYKQMQINVLGTMMDQVLFKSPYDQIGNESIREKEWHPDARKEVYVDGTVNKPGDIDKYWSVEMALSFDNLKDHSERVQPNPIDDEVCFVQFGRSEQHLENVNGEYRKKKNSTTDWWAWQPCDAINLHLQDRWGLVQFKRTLADNEFKFTKWHIYKSLFDMMNGMKKYKALHGRYVNTIEELDIPPYLLSRNCVDIPEIRIEDRNGTKGFDITVKSMFLSHKPAHIREDRYDHSLWYIKTLCMKTDKVRGDIALIGLAVMGQNLVLNMNDHGFTVVAFNRTVAKVEQFLANEAKGTKVIGAKSLEDMVAQLKKPRRVMLLVKAGQAVDDFIDKLLPHLEKGDIIIDGGNSEYSDTNRRCKALEAKGLLYVGSGVSGGEDGARYGPSLMPGGSPAAWWAQRELATL
ncbi:6PGD-like protein, partial [Mya arenaria]